MLNAIASPPDSSWCRRPEFPSGAAPRITRQASPTERGSTPGRFARPRPHFRGPGCPPVSVAAPRPPERETVSKKLYVGNLAFGTTSEDLTALFGQYGSVTSAQVVTDRETGRSRGFAFVEMGSGAEEATRALN